MIADVPPPLACESLAGTAVERDTALATASAMSGQTNATLKKDVERVTCRWRHAR
jgi:hypothetical protein